VAYKLIAYVDETMTAAAVLNYRRTECEPRDVRTRGQNEFTAQVENRISVVLQHQRTRGCSGDVTNDVKQNSCRRHQYARMQGLRAGSRLN